MSVRWVPQIGRERLRRLRDWLATDKGLLLILAGVFTCRALSFLGEPPTVLMHRLELGAPWLSPTLWAAPAVLLLVALRRDSPRLETVALCCATAVLSLWGVLFLWTEPVPIPGPWPHWLEWLRRVLEVLMHFLSRGVLYIGLAAMAIYTVWRGQTARIDVRGDDGRA